MSNLHKTRMLILAAWVIAAGICLPVVFGTPREVSGQSGGDNWRNLIYDFQTLITGVAAVFAATFTVRQMNHDDKEQNRRHHETLAFAIRSEIRRMDRGLHPQLGDLGLVASKMLRLSFQIEWDKPHPEYTWFSEICPQLQPIVHDLIEILERPAIRDASEYFDGNLLVAFDRAYSCALDVRRYVDRHIDVQHVYDTETHNDFMRYEQDEWPSVGGYRVETTLCFKDHVCLLVERMEKAGAELLEMKARFQL